MRRSGISSPRSSVAQNTVSSKQEHQPQKNTDADLGVWEEPPLRNPVPSFEDYKGLERHGVLEHMAPLGSLPSSKVKARMRQHEPSRRAAHLKNGEARAPSHDVSTPEPAPQVATRPSEPRKEERRPHASSSGERGGDRDYHTRAHPKIKPPPASPARPPTMLSPTSRIPAVETRLEKIVEAAVKRASALGNADTGLAIRKLYEDSTQDQTLAELLDAVLSQRHTEQQVADFQDYIRVTRKQLRKDKDRGHRSTPSMSKSPAKSLRNSATRQLETSNSADSPKLNHLPSTSNHISSKPQVGRMSTNGSPSKDERPSKRFKRSNSASSDSSLSSLNSDIEEFAPDKVESTISKTSNKHMPSQKARPFPGPGPRLGSFATTRHLDPTRLPPSNENSESIVAAKRRLQNLTSLHNYAVKDSSVRLPSSLTPQSTPPLTSLQQRNQQPRRNGIAHRGKRDDDDSIDSPLSSQGDLLILPPHGARGGTPNNLGRPPKAVKKAARIKQS